MNIVILKGRLGKDPETSYTQTGKQITRFSLATSKRYTDSQSGEKTEKTEWHRVTLWDKTAAIAAQYLAKGREVLIRGEIQYRQYTDKDGQTRQATEIIGQELELIGGRGEAGAGAGAAGYPAAGAAGYPPAGGGYAPGGGGAPAPGGARYAQGSGSGPLGPDPGYRPAPPPSHPGNGYPPATPPGGAPGFDDDIPF